MEKEEREYPREISEQDFRNLVHNAKSLLRGQLIDTQLHLGQFLALEEKVLHARENNLQVRFYQVNEEGALEIRCQKKPRFGFRK